MNTPKNYRFNKIVRLFASPLIALVALVIFGGAKGGCTEATKAAYNDAVVVQHLDAIKEACGSNFEKTVYSNRLEYCARNIVGPQACLDKMDDLGPSTASRAESAIRIHLQEGESISCTYSDSVEDNNERRYRCITCTLTK